MAVGEHYIAVTCACGHNRLTWLADWPEEMRIPNGFGLRSDVVARLACTVCGRRGPPQSIMIGWDAGPKSGREHVRREGVRSRDPRDVR